MDVTDEISHLESEFQEYSQTPLFQSKLQGLLGRLEGIDCESRTDELWSILRTLGESKQLLSLACIRKWLLVSLALLSRTSPETVQLHVDLVTQSIFQFRYGYAIKFAGASGLDLDQLCQLYVSEVGTLLAGYIRDQAGCDMNSINVFINAPELDCVCDQLASCVRLLENQS